jgi:putative ABC transport system permease protein
VKELRPSILVAALSSSFGVTLLLVISVLSQVISADSVVGESQTAVPLMLSIVASIFIVIAVYVSAIVTANTFSTIIAGRTRTIALYRLIGSTARAQRRSVAGEGLIVGVVGALIGAVVSVVLVAVGVQVGVLSNNLPSLTYSYAEVSSYIPVPIVVLTTRPAPWIGSRRVLVVTPMQATGAAVESSADELNRRVGRSAAAVSLFAIGWVLLALGIAVGLVSPFGVLIGLVGGVVSFTGLVLGAHLVMPPALRLVGRAFGRSATARLAAENAVRHPERSARTTIGLVIGVTLVTMFAVAAASYQSMIYTAQQNQPELYQGVDTVLIITVVVFSVLMGFSALIAAVGMVNNLSLSVLQRTREFGLLRALGFTKKQVRAMIVSEAAQLTITAVLVGLVLGIGYGWAGAQSMLGSMYGSPGLVAPTVPLVLLAVLVVCAAGLTVAASLAPSRRATRVSPVLALAVE